MVKQQNSARLAGLMCLVMAIACLATCLLYNQWLLVLFDPSPPLAADTLTAIHVAQAVLAMCGAVLLTLAWLLTSARWQPLAERAFDSRLRLRLLLLLLFGILPVGLAELIARPLVPTDGRTTIFERDSELGWRLKPGASDNWGGLPVTINGKGLRGPELPYEKPGDVLRVLFLGDSVTFGYQLASAQQAFPYLIEAQLKQHQEIRVETINAGVGGYSPWQYERFLLTEGIKYDPDFVVIGFVLNDVTEKMNLTRFGGQTAGWQLAHSANNLAGWLSRRSALYRLAERVAGRVRYGSNPQAGAIAYELDFVHELAEKPASQRVQKAWEITLENLNCLARSCQQHDLPLLLVVFPYAFQLQDVQGLTAPQLRLHEFSTQQGVPLLDLLTPIRNHLDTTGKPVEDLYLDANHLSAAGHKLVASSIAEALGQLPDWPQRSPAGPSAGDSLER